MLLSNAWILLVPNPFIRVRIIRLYIEPNGLFDELDRLFEEYGRTDYQGWIYQELDTRRLYQLVLKVAPER